MLRRWWPVCDRRAGNGNDVTDEVDGPGDTTPGKDADVGEDWIWARSRSTSWPRRRREMSRTWDDGDGALRPLESDCATPVDIETTLDLGLSNALVESVNTKTRLLTRIAICFYSAEALISLTPSPSADSAHRSRAAK